MGFNLVGPLLFGLLVASLKIEVLAALDCYMCVNLEDMPDSVPECDYPGLDYLQTCPESTVHCLSFEGVTSRPHGETVSGVIRLCGPPTSPVNDTTLPNDPENKCYCDQDAAYWLEVLLPVIAPTDLIVKGGICFCDEDGCNHSNSTEGACPHHHDDESTTPDPNGVVSHQPLMWVVGLLVGSAYIFHAH